MSNNNDNRNNRRDNQNRTNNGNNRFQEPKKVITPFFPLPRSSFSLLRSDSANFSLSFPRFTEWRIGKGKIELLNSINEKKEEFANGYSLVNDFLCELGNKQLKDKQKYLDKLINNQKEYLDVAKGKTLSAKLSSPFITGLGSGHPTETGMILDRNTGVPYIPASSIKGVLRTAWAVNIADENGNASDKVLDEIFGSQDGISKIILLDAYPQTIPVIQSDIMNPHFREYYSGKDNAHKKPIETEAPLPVKFLSIKPGTVFNFNYIITDQSVKNEDVIAAFNTAFTLIGFGGKTAIGYGRFLPTPEYYT